MARDKGQGQGQEDFLATAGTQDQAAEQPGNVPAGEFDPTQNADHSAPSAEEAAAEAKDTRIWKIGDAEVSKSEFVRDQFTNHNKSRKDISEEFTIPYRTVYGATVNMVNEAEPATRGRSASVSKINVTADGHIVTVVKDGDVEVTHVDNVAVSDEDAAKLETTEVDRNTWIKAQVEAGIERGKIATALGLSYGVIYSMTKEVEGNNQRHDMDWEGETVSRSEYIRRLHATGTVSKSDIAKQLGVDYPVVWSALKSLKSEDDKYSEAVEKLAKFEDQVTDIESFKALIEMLKGVTLKEVAPAPVADEQAAAASESTQA